MTCYQIPVDKGSCGGRAGSVLSKMRFTALVLLFWCVSATAGFVIRNIYYVNATEAEDNRMPAVGTSLIQVKPSEKTPDKPKSILETIPQRPNFLKSVESPRLPDTRFKLPKRRRLRRELFWDEALMRELEGLMLSGSTFGRQREERTLIQAPLFQKSCPPGQKLDRARKKCRGPW